jgi:hypothetical protein
VIQGIKFCSKFKVLRILQIERECRPRHYEPNATRLGSNRRREREISHFVQNDKQAKKGMLTIQSIRMLTWHVHTTHGRAGLAGPYDMWHSLVDRYGRMILRHVADFGWLYGATWPSRGLPHGTLLLVGCIKFIWSPPDSTP